MAVVIPFFNNFSNFRQEVNLNNVSYLLDFTWNVRSEQWTLSILNPDETPIIYGLKLVLNYPLLDQFNYLNLPDGEILCVDTTGEEKQITRNNLGDTIQIVFLNQTEVAEALT